MTSSMRARMTLGLTLFIAALTALGGAGLWLEARSQARAGARVLLAATAARVREEVRNGANWPQIAAAVRDQNLNASTGEVELWRLGPEGREVDHVRAPHAPKIKAPRAPQPPGSLAPGISAPKTRPIPPLDDPGGWMTRRVTWRGQTLLVGVPWHKTRRALDAQALALLLLGLLTSGAAGAGAWVLVGRTLSPIERLAAQARARAAEGRDAGAVVLRAPSPDREMRELVSTFNALLDSVAQTARQRERFHTSVSHELRTPLQALSGTLQLALARPRPPEELRLALANALDQSQRLNRLTRDLLTLNQLENSVAATSRESVDVAQICDLALSSLQDALAQNALQLSETLTLLSVLSRPSHLEMLCRNLLENAVKYAPSGASVSVETVTRENGGPLLRVCNSTAWPVEGDLNAWLEPFYRPDAARSSGAGGNGLGLAICNAICQANNWTLRLEPFCDGAPGVRAVVRFG